MNAMQSDGLSIQAYSLSHSPSSLSTGTRGVKEMPSTLTILSTATFQQVTTAYVFPSVQQESFWS